MTPFDVQTDLRTRLVGRRGGIPAAKVKSSVIGDSAVGGRQDSSTCVARAATGCDYDTRVGVGDVVDATLRRQAEGTAVDPDSGDEVVTEVVDAQIVGAQVSDVNARIELDGLAGIGVSGMYSSWQVSGMRSSLPTASVVQLVIWSVLALWRAAEAIE